MIAIAVEIPKKKVSASKEASAIKKTIKKAILLVMMPTRWLVLLRRSGDEVLPTVTTSKWV